MALPLSMLARPRTPAARPHASSHTLAVHSRGGVRTPALPRSVAATRTRRGRLALESVQRSSHSGAYQRRGVTLVPAPVRTLPNHAPTLAVKEEAAPEAESAAPRLSVAQQLAQGGSALRQPNALASFFRALQQREDEPGNGTVRILQWGDSHTAADMFTGELRARMQARFGDGGVGFTYAGHPFAGYRILGSGRSQSGSWRTLGTHFTDLGDRLLGMGGVAIESYRAGDTATLDAPCLSFTLQYLRQPGGGGLQVTDNGQTIATLSTADANAAPVTGTPNDASLADQSAQQPDAAIENPNVLTDPGSQDAAQESVGQGSTQTGTGAARAGSGGTFRYSCQPGTHRFTMTAQGGGPVRLLGTVTLQPGITWEAMGINGAEAPLILRWNQPLFQGYLAAAQPALIVLAYGTNEAAARWTGEDYRQTFARLIDMLHRTSPQSSILVLGPGDRSLGSTYYTTTYTTVGRGRRARRVRHQVAHRTYTPYRGTDRILNAQQSVCSTTGLCAFWDWRARQGGFGSMNRWVSSGYAQPDHTHLTGTGYRALADALAADLLSAYSQFSADRNGSPTVP